MRSLIDHQFHNHKQNAMKTVVLGGCALAMIILVSVINQTAGLQEQTNSEASVLGVSTDRTSAKIFTVDQKNGNAKIVIQFTSAEEKVYGDIFFQISGNLELTAATCTESITCSTSLQGRYLVVSIKDLHTAIASDIVVDIEYNGGTSGSLIMDNSVENYSSLYESGSGANLIAGKRFALYLGKLVVENE